MNAMQLTLTTVMSVLMLATFVAMPSQPVKSAVPPTKRVGTITVKVENRAELPAEQVRDLAY